jgi:putative spermidine/putrescine transport system permease protein
MRTPLALRLANGLLVALLMAFLLAPVLLVFPISFSADTHMAWPPSGWSTRWYVQLAQDGTMLAAFRNSLVLALVVTLLSLAIGLPASVVLVRRAFPGREAVLALLTAPLLLPSIVLGLAILIVFVGQGLIGSWTGMVLAHLTLTLPYAVRVLSTGLRTLPPSVEDAAATLGGRPLTVFRRVTLPLMAPSLVACSALCFLVSFDEVVVSLFIVGPHLKVLPVSLYHYVESRTDPLVAAASALMILGSLAIVLVLERAIGLRKAMGGG